MVGYGWERWHHVSGMRDGRLGQGKAQAAGPCVYSVVYWDWSWTGQGEYKAVAGADIVKQGLSVGGQGEPDVVTTAKADLSGDCEAHQPVSGGLQVEG